MPKKYLAEGQMDALEIENSEKSICQGVRQPDIFGKELRKSREGSGVENLGCLLHSGMFKKQNVGKREDREDVTEPQRRMSARENGGVYEDGIEIESAGGKTLRML